MSKVVKTYGYGSDTTTVTDNLFFLLYLFKIYKPSNNRGKREPAIMKILAHEWEEFKLDEGDRITEVLSGNKKDV